jgi:hypothetical protein
MAGANFASGLSNDDAIGVRINSLPVTPEKVLEAHHEKENR